MIPSAAATRSCGGPLSFCTHRRRKRAKIPPFLIFKKYPTPRSSRSVQFKGLAVPGFTGLPSTADLVAVWRTAEGQRFQNYRAVFTVLNTPVRAFMAAGGD